MKFIYKYAVPVLIGLAAAMLVGLVLFPLWWGLHWHRPVAEWLTGNGLPESVAAYLVMVWMKLPDWLGAFGTGLLVGVLRRQSEWLGYALLACLGYILVPHFLQLVIWGDHPLLHFGVTVLVNLILWQAVAIPLLLLGAWIALRVYRPTASADAQHAAPRTA